MKLPRLDYNIIGILVLGFILRIAGVHFGLPHLYHADEPIIVNHALAYGTGDFNPHFFKIPPLVSYALFALFGFYFLAGILTGQFRSLRDFEHLYYVDPTSFYLLARIAMGVIPGTLTVYCLYRLVKKDFDEKRALLSSFFLAVAFLHVSDSHYVYVDIPLALTFVLAFSSFFKLIESRSVSLLPHLISGVWIGLATAIKYNGAVFAIPYAVATSLSMSKRARLASWLLGMSFSGLIYLILNPYTLLDFKFFLQEIFVEYKSHQAVTGWLYPLTFSLLGALELPLLAVSLGGWMDCLHKFCFLRSGGGGEPEAIKDKKKVCFALFLLVYYFILVQWGQPYGRYVLPMIPFLVFFAADFITRLSERIKAKHSFHVLVIGVLVIALPSLAKAAFFDRLMSRDDTRTLAKKWVEQNVPAGSRIALDHGFYMPQLLLSPSQLLRKQEKMKGKPFFSPLLEQRLEFLKTLAAQHPSYELYSLSGQPERPEEEFSLMKPKVPYSLNQLRVLGMNYVIVVRLREKDLYQDFYNQLEQEEELVAEFNPYRSVSRKWPYEHPLTGGPFLWRDVMERERNGQPLKIYRIS